MTPPRSEGFVRMPGAEFEAILTRAAEEGAKRALADVGLDGDEAALDIRDLRSLVGCIRLVRRTAMQTAVRMITTGRRHSRRRRRSADPCLDAETKPERDDLGDPPITSRAVPDHHAALELAQVGARVLVLEYSDQPFRHGSERLAIGGQSVVRTFGLRHVVETGHCYILWHPQAQTMTDSVDGADRKCVVLTDKDVGQFGARATTQLLRNSLKGKLRIVHRH
jgi:hypothetical protein